MTYSVWYYSSPTLGNNPRVRRPSLSKPEDCLLGELQHHTNNAHSPQRAGLQRSIITDSDD